MITTTSLSLLNNLRGTVDQRAWHEFFHRYGPMLIAFGKRSGLCDADANDAVQETLLAVHATFREMDEPFDRSKGKFKSWLRGIAQHKIRDVQRRAARARARRDPRDPDDTGAAVVESEANEVFELEWQRSLLARALDEVSRKVDPAVYQAFELYAIHGQAPDQVAKLLGVTRNAVYISKTRVLKRLRAVLGRLQEEEG